MTTDAQRRAIQALIYLASFDARREEDADGRAEVVLPDGWEQQVAGKAILFDRRGDQDCIRVVTQEEAIEFGRSRAGRDG